MHRRNSSLAVIDRGIVQAGAPVPSITITSTLDKQYEQQQQQQFHTSTMAIVRRRIRPIAILLAVSAFLLLLLMGGVFRSGPRGSSSSSSRVPFAVNDDDSREPLANRPYPPSLAPGRIPPHGAGTDITDDSKPIANPYRGKGKSATSSSTSSSSSGGTPALKLTLAEELGAVVAYLTSLGANARIPDTMDPSQPIDAELILGFNTRSARAGAEVAELVRETWEINPVVMFGEARQPTTKHLKRVLESLNISPKPVLIFLDERDDSALLTPLVERLTGGTTFPILLVGGQYQGTLDDVLVMHTSGELQKRLVAAGARIPKSKMAKKEKREEVIN